MGLATQREGERAARAARRRRAGRPSRAGRVGYAEQAMRRAGPRPGRREGKEEGTAPVPGAGLKRKKANF